eukprot:2891219-Alexandrium_andersonii.AAC.1
MSATQGQESPGGRSVGRCAVAAATLEDLLGYPLSVADDLKLAVARCLLPTNSFHALVENCDLNFAAFSSYSGLGAWELAGEYLAQALDLAGWRDAKPIFR